MKAKLRRVERKICRGWSNGSACGEQDEQVAELPFNANFSRQSNEVSELENVKDRRSDKEMKSTLCSFLESGADCLNRKQFQDRVREKGEKNF